MAEYDAYIARSLTNPSNMNGQAGFHLRISKKAMDNSTPFLDFDPNVSDPVTVTQSTVGDVTHYVVDVWLVETNISKSLIEENWIFTESSPLDYDKLFGKIVLHKRNPDNDEETEEESNDDLLYEVMPAEYPIGN